jgi:hypothetical protein
LFYPIIQGGNLGELVKSFPDSDVYLIGHSRGTNAIVGGLYSIYEKSRDLPSSIEKIALLDMYLIAGGADIANGWIPDLDSNPPAYLFTQNNADELISETGDIWWIGRSWFDMQPSNFPRVGNDPIDYGNLDHYQLAVDQTVFHDILNFFFGTK